MKEQLKEQITRVEMLLQMNKDLLADYERAETTIEQWLSVNTTKPRWYAPNNPITRARLKRSMLVLRQETIKLSKML